MDKDSLGMGQSQGQNEPSNSESESSFSLSLGSEQHPRLTNTISNWSNAKNNLTSKVSWRNQWRCVGGLLVRCASAKGPHCSILLSPPLTVWPGTPPVHPCSSTPVPRLQLVGVLDEGHIATLDQSRLSSVNVDDYKYTRVLQN